jgi:hypothetical protein
MYRTFEKRGRGLIS